MSGFNGMFLTCISLASNAAFYFNRHIPLSHTDIRKNIALRESLFPLCKIHTRRQKTSIWTLAERPAGIGKGAATTKMQISTGAKLGEVEYLVAGAGFEPAAFRL